MTITIFEPFRAVFYTPFYLSFALDAYRAEGVEVRLASPPPGAGASPAIFTDDDVMWGGPMRLLRHHDADPDCGFVGFCEVVTRDPFLLVGRRPRPSFRFADLVRTRLASVAEVPTPWLCLQEDIRRAGIDPDGLDRVSDRPMAQTVEMLRAGEVDVAQLFEPYVSALVRDGVGHVWHAAAERGATSYTALITSRARAARDPDVLLAITRAMHRTLGWLRAASPERAAEAVAEYFPDCAPDLLAAAIGRYQSARIWGRDTRLPVIGFVRLKAALLSGGLIRRDVPYEACVDSRFADQVTAEDPPPL